MSRVITAIVPVTIFGQTPPALANRRLVKSGDYTAAVIELDAEKGTKFQTIEGQLSKAERSRISAKLRAAAK